MSDNNSTKPTRSLAELRGTAAVISEEQDFRVSPGRNRVNIDEGRNRAEIEESLRNDFLLPDERAKQEQKLEEGKKSKLGKHNAQKRRKPDENARIFEEGDIIDWMFKNIIMKSLDWAGNKVTNLATWVVGGSLDWVASSVASGAKRCKKKMKNSWDKWNPFDGDFGKYPDDNTTKFRKDIADLHNKDMKDCDAYVSDENFMALMNAMHLAHDGHIDELNTMMNGRLSPQTITMLNDLTPAQRQQAFSVENAMETTEDTIETAMVAKHYAANMAYVRIMNDKMKDKNQPKKDKTTLYNEYFEEAHLDMITLMAEAQAAGKSREQIKLVRDELLNLSIEAGKHTDKQIENRHYNEQNGNPDRNKALEKIEDLTAITKESPYRNHTQFVDFSQEVIRISTAHQQAMRPIEQQTATLVQWDNKNQERRQNVSAVRQRIEQRHMANQQTYQRQNGRAL